MSLAVTLKESTAAAHRRAESSDLQRQLAQGGLDAAHLTAYLSQLFRVHSALEALMAQHPDVASGINWSADQEHSRRIASDLKDFGIDVVDQETLEPTAQLLASIDEFVANDPVTLVGLFYVLEGSMNGNRYIVRALRHGPGAARSKYTYFDPYGEEQPASWAAFRAALEAHRLDDARSALVLSAALRMFDGIFEICEEIMPANAVQAS